MKNNVRFNFFNNIEEIKKSFAKLINCKNPDRIAYVPAASYGLANVTNNIKLEKGENVVVVGDQFPSNVYPWMNLTKKYKGNLNFVLKDTSSKNPGRKWNEDILKAIDKKTKVIISIFGGRMGDVGKDPVPEFKKSLQISKNYKNVEILWASTREPYNYIQAKQLGCQIITVPPSIIEKIEKFGKSFQKLTIDTVKGFLRDAKKSNFNL